MSYMICEKCGKEYPIPEGEESFSYQNCSCGGKLKYSPNTIGNSNIPKQNHLNKQYHGPYTQHPRSYTSKPLIKWKGVFVGLAFLFISLIITVMLSFGENLPTSPSDIPREFLTFFGILAIILTTLAGAISSYLSGSKKYLEGALNGGLVGVILGLILGMFGGIVIFISGSLIFGLISMIGGIIGIFPRKLFK